MPTQPPNQCVAEVKRLQHEAANSPASSVDVKNEWSYTFTLRLHGVHMGKKITFTSREKKKNGITHI